MNEKSLKMDPISSDEAAGRYRSEDKFEGGVLHITIIDKEANSKTYYVHQNLLKEKSQYFAALTHFREGAENQVTLKDMDHDTFYQIMYWIYKDGFSSDSCDAKLLIKVWAAADRLCMERCKNMSMDQLRLHFLDYPVYTGALESVLDLGYTANSALAQYIMDQLTYEYISFERKHVDGLRQLCETRIEMAWPLIERLTKVGQEWCRNAEMGCPEPVDPATIVGCAYHDHGEGGRCYLNLREDVETES